MYYIYKITNQKTGLCYIGLTNNIARRRSRHFTDLKCNRHDNSFLLKHYNRDGAQSFTFEVLFLGDVSDLEIGKLELYYILLYDSYLNGYNQNESGNFGPSNGGSHLTKSDIFNILAVLEFNPKRNGLVLADLFEVSRATISRIGKGINHCDVKAEYDKLPIQDRQDIYTIFCNSQNLIQKVVESNKLIAKRQLTKEQVFLLLLNEELNRPVLQNKLLERFNIKSNNTLRCILKGQSYLDYILEYLQLTDVQKKQLATLLRN